MTLLSGLIKDPTPGTTTTGDIIDTDIHNNICDIISGDHTSKIPKTAIGFSGASVRNSSTQSILNGVNTKLTFDTEEFDTANYHSIVTNTSRFTVPTSGYYQIFAQVHWQGASGGTTRRIAIMKNGTTYISLTRIGPLSTNSPAQECSRLCYLSAGDYVEVEVSQDSGGTLTVNVFSESSPGFSIELRGV